MITALLASVRGVFCLVMKDNNAELDLLHFFTEIKKLIETSVFEKKSESTDEPINNFDEFIKSQCVQLEKRKSPNHLDVLFPYAFSGLMILLNDLLQELSSRHDRIDFTDGIILRTITLAEKQQSEKSQNKKKKRITEEIEKGIRSSDKRDITDYINLIRNSNCHTFEIILSN